MAESDWNNSLANLGLCRSLFRELERRLAAELQVLMRNGASIARAVVDGRSPNQAKTDGSAYTRELGIKPIEVRFVEEQRAVKKKRFRLVRARCQSGLRTVDEPHLVPRRFCLESGNSGSLSHFMLNQYEQASEMF